MIIALAAICYGVFIWAALNKFIPDDQSSRNKRLLVSLVGGISIIYFTTIVAISETRWQWQAASSICYAFSISLFYWAITQFKLDKIGFAGSKVPPLRLINTGPYRFVRHPIYLSYLLGWTGGSLMAHQWFTVAIAIFLTLTMGSIYLNAAVAEEKAIATSDFATDYAHYASSNKRIIPFLL